MHAGSEVSLNSELNLLKRHKVRNLLLVNHSSFRKNCMHNIIVLVWNFFLRQIITVSQMVRILSVAA